VHLSRLFDYLIDLCCLCLAGIWHQAGCCCSPTPTPYSPTPYSPTPYSPTPYSPTPYSPTPYSPTPYSPTPYSPTPYSPTPYSPTPYSPTPYSPTPYSPTPYSPTGPYDPCCQATYPVSNHQVCYNDGDCVDSGFPDTVDVACASDPDCAAWTGDCTYTKGTTMYCWENNCYIDYIYSSNDCAPPS